VIVLYPNDKVILSEVCLTLHTYIVTF